jgi:CubicO group peptidase (beta-lactamase class C family)
MTDRLNDELSNELRAQLTSIVEKRVAEEKCPSVFARLFQRGAHLFDLGVGQSRIGGPTPSAESVYRIASCSKSFTVAMLLILRDRGLLSLDAPITDFVPEYTQVKFGETYEPPTLRMLMSMSGGLPTDDPWADRQESISNAELRRYVAGGVNITCPPGTKFQYSNLGYALLGQVIEVVAHTPLQVIISDEILRPLALLETGYTQNVVGADHLAHGYRPRRDEWVELPFSGPGAFSCIGGLFSSGRDLATWAQWLSSAQGVQPDESGPLSVASRREMQQVVTAIPFAPAPATAERNAHREFGYGLGLFTDYDERYGAFVSHSGGYPGFSSHMRWHVPTGLGVVVLENATYSGAWDTATELIDAVLADRDYRLPAVEVWPETREMAGRADALIRNWDSAVAAAIFAENVALDVPLEEREASIKSLIGELGGLTVSTSLPLESHKSDSPLHMTWTVPGERGALTCEIRLAPTSPSLIQTINVTKQSPQ